MSGFEKSGGSDGADKAPGPEDCLLRAGLMSNAFTNMLRSTEMPTSYGDGGGFSLASGITSTNLLSGGHADVSQINPTALATRHVG